jgi:hypothetical protein
MACALCCARLRTSSGHQVKPRLLFLQRVYSTAALSARMLSESDAVDDPNDVADLWSLWLICSHGGHHLGLQPPGYHLTATWSVDRHLRGLAGAESALWRTVLDLIDAGCGLLELLAACSVRALRSRFRWRSR